jgi:tetratricopeptide (TPR) repeat protein
MRLPAHIAFIVLLFASARPICAQAVDPSTPPPPPAEQSAATPAPAEPVRAQPIDPSTPPPPPPAEEPVAPAAPAEPAFDPLHAERDVEVGAFYLKRGNYDAAIDRFEEATHYEPALARPWSLMGEAYEKKRDTARAVACYKKYLEIFPHAPDADKIKKRIADLEEKIPQQTSKPSSN